MRDSALLMHRTLLLLLTLGGSLQLVQDTSVNTEVNSEHSLQFSRVPTEFRESTDEGSPWNVVDNWTIYSRLLYSTPSRSFPVTSQSTISTSTVTYPPDISTETSPYPLHSHISTSFSDIKTSDRDTTTMVNNKNYDKDNTMQILSQVKANSNSSKNANSVKGDRESVMSPLGSVDVVVPSLRGMELPTDLINNKNKSSAGQRLGRTDAPMLNYIFDTYSTLNKHYHRNDRFGGPRIVSQGSTVTVDTQARAELDCKVTSLQDKLVSWVRRKPEDDTLEIITIGQQTFTADLRFSVMYLVPDTWRLIVDPARPEDSGSYECQLSTHPPIISKHHLLVQPPSVRIVDGEKDRYYERNSTLSLSCAVRHLPGAQVTWMHHQMNLNDDITRGGISVKTDSIDGGADSTLQVARLTHSDSGVYTCLVRDSLQDIIIVHVLNESLAELHQGSSGTTFYSSVEHLSLIIMVLIIFNMYDHR